MSLKKLIKDIENLEKYLNMFINNYAKCVTIKDTMCDVDVTGYYPKKFIIESEDKYIKTVTINKGKPTESKERRTIYNGEYETSVMYKLINKMLEVSEVGGKVKCVYSNEEKDVSNIIGNKYKIKELAKTFNEEHIIPAGIYSRAMPIVYDLHNVFPCNQEINKARSNYVFADDRKFDDNKKARMDDENVKIYEPKLFYDYINLKDTKAKKQKEYNLYKRITNKRDTNQEKQLGKMRDEINTYENRYGSQCYFGSCYITPYKNRGMIARSILYFHYIYWRNNKIEQIFDNSKLDNMNGKDVFTKFKEQYRSFMGDKWDVLRLAIKWHLKDAPDKYEINRNNKINNLQGNKNPFIYESFTERLDSLKLIIK